MKINLNEITDPIEGYITVSTDTKGYRRARFGLQDLSWAESLLVGRSTAEALKMIEWLCRPCPAAYHPAGTRALDGLVGVRVKSYTEMIRHLLRYESMIEVHFLRFIVVDHEVGITLKQLSEQMLTGAGPPGRFPDTATPGGTQVEPKLEDLRVAADGLETACAAAQWVAVVPQSQNRGTQIQTEMPFADVALIDDSKYPDVFGTWIRTTHNGEVLEDFDFSQWSEKTAKEIPGSPAPRLYITTLSKEMSHYQAGPVAQLSMGEVSTPRAASLQVQWLSAPPDTTLARVIIGLHILELSGEIVSQLMKTSGDYHLDEQAPTTKQ